MVDLERKAESYQKKNSVLQVRTDAIFIYSCSRMFESVLTVYVV